MIRTPIKPRRRKPRPGRLVGKQLAALRLECYERDNHCCVKCGRWVRWERGCEDSMHMAHVRNKRMYGDNLDNVVTKCFTCHIVIEHQQGDKSLPGRAA